MTPAEFHAEHEQAKAALWRKELGLPDNIAGTVGKDFTLSDILVARRKRDKLSAWIQAAESQILNLLKFETESAILNDGQYRAKRVKKTYPAREAREAKEYDDIQIWKE